MKKILAAVAAMAWLLPGLAVAGSYDQPYGLIESGDRSQTRKEETVAISRIDGVSTRYPRRPDPVAPGKHSVEISFTTARTTGADDLHDLYPLGAGTPGAGPLCRSEGAAAGGTDGRTQDTGSVAGGRGAGAPGYGHARPG